MSLHVVDFGKQLVETGDLDPVYVAIHGANLQPDKLKRFLLAYWYFYSCGTSSWIVDQTDYWNAMRQAASSSDWPRGTERRHFRGEAATTAVEWLAKYPNGFDYLMGPITNGELKQLSAVMNYVITWKQCGKWIAFKVADMVERLGLLRVDFMQADIALYDSPKQGAVELIERYYPKRPPGYWHGIEVGTAFDYLRGELSGFKAPPRYERELNAQEWETILCKWHSHLGGHYEVGKDIHELREGLLRFARWPTAQRLLKGLTDGLKGKTVA